MVLINYIDKVRRKKPDEKRRLNQVTHIVMHHTAWTKDATVDDIAKIHIDQNGWRSVGYHYLITKKGTVYQLKKYEDIGANVKGFNTQSIGIVMNGNFETEMPTPEQIAAGKELVANIMADFGRQLTVIGHREAPKASTACPGIYFPLEEFKAIVYPLQKKKKK